MLHRCSLLPKTFACSQRCFTSVASSLANVVYSSQYLTKEKAHLRHAMLLKWPKLPRFIGLGSRLELRPSKRFPLPSTLILLHYNTSTTTPINTRTSPSQPPLHHFNHINMPRQSRGPAPRPSAPSRPTAAPQPRPAAPQQQQTRPASTAAHPPQQQAQQGSQGPGLFGQMASTAA